MNLASQSVIPLILVVSSLNYIFSNQRLLLGEKKMWLEEHRFKAVSKIINWKNWTKGTGYVELGVKHTIKKTVRYGQILMTYSDTAGKIPWASARIVWELHVVSIFHVCLVHYWKSIEYKIIHSYLFQSSITPSPILKFQTYYIGKSERS